MYLSICFLPTPLLLLALAVSLLSCQSFSSSVTFPLKLFCSCVFPPWSCRVCLSISYLVPAAVNCQLTQIITGTFLHSVTYMPIRNRLKNVVNQIRGGEVGLQCNASRCHSVCIPSDVHYGLIITFRFEGLWKHRNVTCQCFRHSLLLLLLSVDCVFIVDIFVIIPPPSGSSCVLGTL